LQTKKKIIFIGNRSNVLQICESEPSWKIVNIFAAKSSYLQKDLISKSISEFKIFHFKDKEDVCRAIESSNYDILVSNGCPFILPIHRLKTGSQLFLNTHPSLLPELKGPHPVNGAVLRRHKKFGATTHYMTEKVDAGNIILQKSEELTPDLRIEDIYRRSFELEREVFRNAVKILKENDYDYPGQIQMNPGSFYKRREEDMTLDFKLETREEILTKIRAFGLQTLGCTAILSSGKYKIFSAEPVENNAPPSAAPGASQWTHDKKLLIQSINGWVKTSDFRSIS
jgi:methionyl-tRNA formyltransferase